MEPISEGIIQASEGVHERNRRAWGVFTLSVAGVGAFFEAERSTRSFSDPIDLALAQIADQEVAILDGESADEELRSRQTRGRLFVEPKA